jgi:hypothetical protein
LNNAVMGFWTVQRGLIRQFFTHNAYKLICRQLFNPNMQADLPWQTSTHKCQIDLPKWDVKTTELLNCQIEFVLPNWIAELNCRIVKDWIRFAKLNCQTELPNCQIEFVLPNWIAKLNCLTEFPNQISELNCRIVKLNSICQTELSNWIAEPNCQIVKLNSFCQTELPNWIAELSNWIRFDKLNCQNKLSNWIAELNCRTKLPNRVAE